MSTPLACYIEFHDTTGSVAALQLLGDRSSCFGCKKGIGLKACTLKGHLGSMSGLHALYGRLQQSYHVSGTKWMLGRTTGARCSGPPP